MDLQIENNAIVLPGETIASLTEACDIVLGLGVKVMHQDDVARIISTAAGFLRVTEAPEALSADRLLVSVESANTNHSPQIGDLVVGVIQRETGGFYFVDINYSLSLAVLDVTAFDGATRYNRPKLQRGDIVYAHIIHCNRGNEPEISCCATEGLTRRDWVTGQGEFGQLKNGHVVNVPAFIARMLLSKQIRILETMSKFASFDVAIGTNGRLWLTADSPKITLAIAYILEGCATKGPLAMEEEVARVFVKD